ncbi:MAG: branched-chain amino acid ABC transporter permease [Burkholderiales bacterium]|nr:branched-chain amino acid ABC transporter permease [Burkholderiales bacterium]
MFSQQLVNGITLGSTYALIAIGYTLVLGVLKKLNLAHGELFMVGTFAGIGMAAAGAPIVVSVGAAFLFAGLVAVAIERTCFYPLRNASFLSPMLTTIAFGILLQNVATQIFGSDPSRFPDTGRSVELHIAGLTISALQVAILVTAFGLMIAIDVLIRHTRWGIALRATSDDPETAAQHGINPSRVTITTFFVSGALAGVAGVLTTLVYSQVTPLIGIRQGLIGMVAMVIGGLGNLRGAMIGGLAVGLLETLNDAYFNAGYRDLVIFSVFFAFLVLRPEGLFPAPGGRS